MGVEASAYAILGLRPGADRAAIDQAYRRLIKLHHPDRCGGDASRAAEINRAYFELRRKPPPGRSHQPDGGGIAEAIYARRAARRGVVRPVRKRRVWPYLAAAVLALAVAERGRLGEWLLDAQDLATGGWRPSVGGSPIPQRRAGAAAIDGELSGTAIDSAIGQARGLIQARSGDGLAAESRECHRLLRDDPSVEQLDRCAAFDYAVALLEDRDPVQDQGQFSASAVTARQMAAARLMSNDYLAIEGRLDRLRGRVEMALAPESGPSDSPP